jgi:hypothetical protein
MYFLYGKHNYEDDKITLLLEENNGEIKKIIDLKSYISKGNDDIDNIGELIKCDIEEFLKY